MLLKGKSVVITAGPTHEPIDPVRFIGNHSSGKMGYSIAKELINRGALVSLVTGPTNLEAPEGVDFIKVKSAKEMYEAVAPLASKANIIILSAAVADYTPKHVATEKIKKSEAEFSIELVKTIDIAKTLGENKKDDQIHIGFALETNNEVSNAELKLKSKNLDFIVLNSLRNPGTCFGSDNNQISIIEENKKTDFELKSKDKVAFDIIDYLEDIIDEKNS